MLRGYSVSVCIRDILEGRVALEDVAEIVGNTAARDIPAWDQVIQTYQELYWGADPERGAAICRQLITEGRIRQPRLENPEYGHNPQIVWEDVGAPFQVRSWRRFTDFDRHVRVTLHIVRAGAERALCGKVSQGMEPQGMEPSDVATMGYQYYGITQPCQGCAKRYRRDHGLRERV